MCKEFRQFWPKTPKHVKYSDKESVCVGSVRQWPRRTDFKNHDFLFRTLFQGVITCFNVTNIANPAKHQPTTTIGQMINPLLSNEYAFFPGRISFAFMPDSKFRITLLINARFVPKVEFV
jgi:hypothetical protein